MSNKGIGAGRELHVHRGSVVELAAGELDKVRSLAPGGDAEPLLDFLAGRRVVVGDLIGAAKALCAENEALRAAVSDLGGKRFS